MLDAVLIFMMLVVPVLLLALGFVLPVWFIVFLLHRREKRLAALQPTRSAGPLLPYENATLQLMLCSVAAGLMLLNCLNVRRPPETFAAYFSAELWIIAACVLAWTGIYQVTRRRRPWPEAFDDATRRRNNRAVMVWFMLLLSVCGALYSASLLLPGEWGQLMAAAATCLGAVMALNLAANWRQAAETIRKRATQAPSADEAEAVRRRGERITLLRRLTLWMLANAVLNGIALVLLISRHAGVLARAMAAGEGVRVFVVEAPAYLATLYILFFTSQYVYYRRMLPVPRWQTVSLWIALAVAVLLFGYGFTHSSFIMSLAAVMLIAVWLLLLMQLWWLAPLLVDATVAMSKPAAPESAPAAGESVLPEVESAPAAPPAKAVPTWRIWVHMVLLLVFLALVGATCFAPRRSDADADNHRFMAPGTVLVEVGMAGHEGTLTPVPDAVYAGRFYPGQGDNPTGMIVTATDSVSGTGLLITGSSGRQERGRYLLQGEDSSVDIQFPAQGDYRVSVTGGDRERVFKLYGMGISLTPVDCGAVE